MISDLIDPLVLSLQFCFPIFLLISTPFQTRFLNECAYFQGFRIGRIKMTEILVRPAGNNGSSEERNRPADFEAASVD